MRVAITGRASPGEALVIAAVVTALGLIATMPRDFVGSEAVRRPPVRLADRAPCPPPKAVTSRVIACADSPAAKESLPGARVARH
jgi:hypothetical protein